MSAKCQYRPNAVQQEEALFDHLVGAGEQRNADSGNADGILRASAQMRSGMLWHVLQPCLLSSRCPGLFGSLVQPCELVLVEQGFPIDLREDV
jgi:hypothetical protein